MSFSLGERVGPYQIQELLGQGGMAAVYKAYHPALDRYVAIKAMDNALGKDPGFLERFKREAQVIAKLDNIHIVPVFDFSEQEGQPYIVLKLIDGLTLRDRMKIAPLSNSEILDIVVAVGDGLQYAHDRHVLHRDVKPSNVLIARDGKIYISDFGLARIAESASNLTGDMLVGTPHYISPEQAMNAEKLDEGTDIYSFGVMIYEMVLGRLPFNSESVITVIEDHMFTAPPAPTSIKPSISTELETVLLKALAKKREERFDKVSGLVRAFKQCWAGHARDESISSTTMEAETIAALLAENGKSFPLAGEITVLGRDSTSKNIHNDIDLSELDIKKIISRRHAAIRHENDEFMLYDLDSRNGTFINGERMSSSQPQKLTSGDVIQFGSGGVKLTFTR
jgi:eukaryotic-like serine/threonine-protein kinase